MAYVSSYEVEVRSYELDVYNHVNNAVYLNWLEHGRSKLLQDKGFDYLSIMDAWGVQFMTVPELGNVPIPHGKRSRADCRSRGRGGRSASRG